MKDNLKEERIMILEMVKENKISTEDATKLLSSLQGEKLVNFDNEELEEKFSKFYSSVDSFAKDLKTRLDKAYKDAEPKVKNATKKVMEKTANVMGDLSTSLNESVKKMEEKEFIKNEDEML